MTAELGYEIVETNFDAQKGEFDIIAKSDSILVFIKVKTRTNQKSGFGVDQISSRKVQHLQATALRYIKKVSNFDVDID
ncbi:MAG: YraN family protein [Chloroflexi bacterium]|nr:YraN family protein [Chloroflexota bacterium]